MNHLEAFMSEDAKRRCVVNVGEANRVRACLDCGEPGAFLWRTTKGKNPGRAWTKTHLGESPLSKAEAHRLAHKLRDPKFYTARTKRAVNSGGVR